MPTTMTPYEHDASIRLAKINAGWQEPLYQPTIKWEVPVYRHKLRSPYHVGTISHVSATILDMLDTIIRRLKPSEPEQYLTPNISRHSTARQLSGYLKSRR